MKDKIVPRLPAIAFNVIMVMLLYAGFTAAQTVFFDHDILYNFLIDETVPQCEIYNYTSGGWTFSIAAINVYYNMTGLILGKCSNDFSYTNNSQANGGSYITFNSEGRYSIDATFSFMSSGSGNDYGLAAARNFDENISRDCYSRRRGTGSTGNVGITCVMDFDSGDTLNLKLEQEIAPARDVTVFTMNLNVVRIDDLEGVSESTGSIYVLKSGDTMTGNLIVNANLTVDTTDLFVDSSLGNVGIGTAAPGDTLHVAGDIRTTSTKGLIVPTSNTYSFTRLNDADTGFYFNVSSTRFEFHRDGAIKVFLDAGNSINYFANRVGIGTLTPSYPLQISGQNGDISLYVSHNVSATGYITRTSVFDKAKDPWDYVKDADDFTEDGRVNHSKFYGYSRFNITDYTRPVFIENKSCEEPEICYNVTYPFNKIVEGVNLDMEVSLLRQAVHELRTELCLYDSKYSWCG